MSGIAGIVDFGKGLALQDEISRLADGLSFFPSDRRGLWRGEAVALAHLLLRVTPEDVYDQQPLVDRQTGSTIVADCRIDNREELARMLDISPESCARLPDSAFILHAYRRWGTDCPIRLLGDFSFAIWDSRKKQLFCVRDPMGMRSFLYHPGDRFFAFSNRAHGLFGSPSIPRRLDENKLLEFLVDLHADQVGTQWQGIKRLPAGHAMTVDANGVRQAQYWRPGTAAPIRFAKDEDYVEAFMEVFRQSIACRLRSQKPVAASLSGGLDSSSIAVVAAGLLKERGQKLLTFSWVPREGYVFPRNKRSGVCDETPNIQAILAHCDNLDARFFNASEKSLLGSFDHLYAVTQGILRNSSNYRWWSSMQEQIAASGAQVMLTGIGGNMTFSYTGRRFLADLAGRGHWLRLWREMRLYAQIQQRSMRSILKQDVVRPLMPRQIMRLYARFRQWQRGNWGYTLARLSPERQSQLRARYKALCRNAEYLVTRDLGDERIWMLTQDLITSSLDHTNALDASLGVEMRAPGMDRRLVDYCLAIPLDQYLHQGQPRALIRRAMLGFLPESVRVDHTRGLQGADWHLYFDEEKEEICREVERMAKSDAVRHLLDLDAMQAMTAVWPKDWAGADGGMQYRYKLLRGLAMGRFVRWFNGENG